MPLKITKEEAQRIMQKKGKVRLATFNTYYNFILSKKGEKGVAEVEKKLRDWGYPMDLKKLSKETSLGWVPQARGCLILVAILEYFKWETEDAQKIGYFLSATSFFLKLIIKYIASPEMTFRQAEKLWERHYAFSQLKVADYNIEKKYAIFRIKNFEKFHLALYYSIGGYMLKIVELSTGGKNLKLEITKCIFWDDPYDELKITWE